MVKNIRLIGTPQFVPLINKHYARLQYELLDVYDIAIPSLIDMNLDKNVLWYVSLNEFRVVVEYEYNEYLFLFERGFMTDNGSIPTFLQSFITNNHPMALIGFFCHDLLYQTKQFGDTKSGWKNANTIMADILRWYGLNPVTTQLVKSAVDSPLGWANYQKRFKRDTTPHGSVQSINHNKG